MYSFNLKAIKVNFPCLTANKLCRNYNHFCKL